MDEKKVALVTGGTKGIGGAIVDIFLQEGWHVAITSRDINMAEKCAAQKDSRRITGFQYDVDVPELSKKLVSDVVGEFGRLGLSIL